MEGGGGDKGVAGATPLPRRDISSTQPDFFSTQGGMLGILNGERQGNGKTKKSLQLLLKNIIIHHFTKKYFHVKP
jgi:hypothetical protein